MKTLLITITLFLLGCHPVAPLVSHVIKTPELYYRADSQAKSASFNAQTMSVGETNVRFFEGGAFEGYDVDPDEFVVTAAPAPYSDTIGRRFKRKPAHLLNWAD